MIIYLISLLIYWQTPTIPFRAKEDFTVELKYDMRQRPSKEASITFDHRKVEDRKGPAALPYLTANVTILNATKEEIRFRCDNNFGNSMFNKKAEKSLKYAIEMGYIDDVKDHVSPHVFTVYALNDKRDAINRIELKVLEDGTFLVNDEKRGKF